MCSIENWRSAGGSTNQSLVEFSNSIFFQSAVLSTTCTELPSYTMDNLLTTVVQFDGHCSLLDVGIMEYVIGVHFVNDSKEGIYMVLPLDISTINPHPYQIPPRQL